MSALLRVRLVPRRPTPVAAAHLTPRVIDTDRELWNPGRTRARCPPEMVIGSTLAPLPDALWPSGWSAIDTWQAG